jgi:hypothetical protein
MDNMKPKLKKLVVQALAGLDQIEKDGKVSAEEYMLVLGRVKLAIEARMVRVKPGPGGEAIGPG